MRLAVLTLALMSQIHALVVCGGMIAKKFYINEHNEIVVFTKYGQFEFEKEACTFLLDSNKTEEKREVNASDFIIG